MFAVALYISSLSFGRSSTPSPAHQQEQFSFLLPFPISNIRLDVDNASNSTVTRYGSRDAGKQLWSTVFQLLGNSLSSETVRMNRGVRRVTGDAGVKRGRARAGGGGGGGGDADGGTVKSRTEEPINFTIANSETVATPVAAAVHRGAPSSEGEARKEGE
ncbi:hypothetical protein KQX54_008028 [Cotesia glomerata]|uniref:Uncharacterized protein n=1 Tax=Cotesia glomerata TaxID=32391 RepID=A0AAV7IR91_COTGL|nr:hypothetical protein KQX54_008028 [Cotesia glomerata]